MSTWRDSAKPIIARCIRALYPHKPEGPFTAEEEKDLRAALRKEYPWGERALHPYKIWCSEVNVQLGKKKKAYSDDGPLFGGSDEQR